MFRNRQTCAIRNNIKFMELLAYNNAKDCSKLSIVMASSKESSSRAETSSLPHFLFWRLSISIEE